MLKQCQSRARILPRDETACNNSASWGVCRRAMMKTLKKIPKRGTPRRRGSEGNSLVEFVYDALLQRIVRGHLPSGTMVSELALAQELKVSRTPVHDAVRQLAKDGLVVREGRQRA